MVVAVNSVIALYYYAGVARVMLFEPPPDGDRTPVRVPSAITLAMGVTLVATVAFGFFPGLVGHFGDVATDLASAVGR